MLFDQTSCSDCAAADSTMGAFSFVNMIMYGVFVIILAVHRNTLATATEERPLSAAGQGHYRSSSDYDPTITEDDEQV